MLTLAELNKTTCHITMQYRFNGFSINRMTLMHSNNNPIKLAIINGCEFVSGNCSFNIHNIQNLIDIFASFTDETKTYVGVDMTMLRATARTGVNFLFDAIDSYKIDSYKEEVCVTVQVSCHQKDKQ